MYMNWTKALLHSYLPTYMHTYITYIRTSYMLKPLTSKSWQLFAIKLQPRTWIF